METPTPNVGVSDPSPKPNPKPDFLFKSRSNSHCNSHSHSPSFLVHNGFTSAEYPISDIEMIAIEAVTYTSLKDLLPASPPTVASPTHNSSWYDEIPIKNPLVKHAALAYLQPMSAPLESGDKSLLGRLREKCSCGHGWFGCLAWLGYVVSRIKEALWETRGNEYCFDAEEEEEEEDEEDDEKVD